MLPHVTNVREQQVTEPIAAGTENLQAQIKVQFAKVARNSSPPKGRRYPEKLKSLVRLAFGAGIQLSTLHRLTGVSSTALRRWGANSKAGVRRETAKALPAARRLDVIEADLVQLPKPVIVRLPSGIAIELADGGSLPSILPTLATLEAHHAAAR